MIEGLALDPVGNRRAGVLIEQFAPEQVREMPRHLRGRRGAAASSGDRWTTPYARARATLVHPLGSFQHRRVLMLFFSLPQRAQPSAASLIPGLTRSIRSVRS